MSDLTTYRCPTCGGNGFIDDLELEVPYCHTCSGMVPDTRLQAIADAWNEGDRVPLSYRSEKRYLRTEWPALAVLLDALVEGTADE
ncbi:hypothetical protein LCGC14_1987150 [marine sediment metagenome]|uniref:Uncharacterized protein n=1 Tax=marine sediment metagenome TaxID=412755 RepID=A0A0F9FV65_9ZZZZ